jgi:transcriptional regulator with XRE-family HTH domain
MHPLRKYRQDARISQASLGQEVGVSKAQISRIETLESRPSPDLAKRLEGVTHIPASTLLYGEQAA